MRFPSRLRFRSGALYLYFSLPLSLFFLAKDMSLLTLLRPLPPRGCIEGIRRAQRKNCAPVSRDGNLKSMFTETRQEGAAPPPFLLYTPVNPCKPRACVLQDKYRAKSLYAPQIFLRRSRSLRGYDNVIDQLIPASFRPAPFCVTRFCSQNCELPFGY